jgi:hypothetical protein
LWHSRSQGVGVGRSAGAGEGASAWALSKNISKREIKTGHLPFCQKNVFFQQIDRQFDVSFSSTFFCFIAFSKAPQTALYKKSFRKVFTKQSTKKSKIQNRLFLDLLYGFTSLGLGRFSVPEFKNTKEHIGGKSDQHSQKKRRTPTWLVGSSEAKKVPGLVSFFLDFVFVVF